MTLTTITIGNEPVSYVFLHGLFGQARNWTTIAKSLLPESSLLVDMPNHGYSPWTTDCSYQAMAESVASLLQNAPLQRPYTLVGHSMGGKTAMIVALKYPDLVDRLVIEDIAPVNEDLSSFREYTNAMMSINTATLPSRHAAGVKLREQITDKRMVGFLLQGLQPTSSSHKLIDQHWDWLFNLDLLQSHIADLGSFPTFPQGTQFTGPTLWITGEESEHTLAAYTPAMHQLFPKTQRINVKGAGHWVHADTPNIFIQAVHQFAHNHS